MNDLDKDSSEYIRIPPQVGVAKALSIDPNDIEDGSIEQIGTCYRCKKPIKDWSEGGISTYSFKVSAYSQPYFETVLLCLDCGFTLQKRVLDFIYDSNKE